MYGNTIDDFNLLIDTSDPSKQLSSIDRSVGCVWVFSGEERTCCDFSVARATLAHNSLFARENAPEHHRISERYGVVSSTIQFKKNIVVPRISHAFIADRGRMRTQPHPFSNSLKDLLPPNPDFDGCQTGGALMCFSAGTSNDFQTFLQR